jgi:ADP-ribose pyrophosphatase
VSVRRASVPEILDLRWRVLRAGRPRDTAHLSDDDDATRHWALTEGDAVVGCVSVMAAPEPDGAATWQLRGMAVDPSLQGTGRGTELLHGCMHAVDAPMWCNARIRAVPFYRRAGWRVTSETFDIPNVGPHQRMHWDGTLPLHQGRHLTLVRRGRWEFVRRHEASGVVAIAPITDAGELVVVRQLRPPLGRIVVELPAGLAGDLPGEHEESMQRAAERELFEETGYRAREWTLATSGPSSGGLTDEIVHFFVARGLTLEGPGGGDDSESIEVHAVPLQHLHAWLDERVAAGEAVDPKLWTGLFHALHPRSDTE